MSLWIKRTKKSKIIGFYNANYIKIDKWLDIFTKKLSKTSKVYIFVKLIASCTTSIYVFVLFTYFILKLINNKFSNSIEYTTLHFMTTYMVLFCLASQRNVLKYSNFAITILSFNCGLFMNKY